MDKPFKYIIDTAVYNLRWNGYGWGRGDVEETIDKCITDTAVHYDQTQVTPAQFKKMVDKITQGASTSPIAQRKCVDAAVQQICIYYPGHMTATNVTSLLKCFDSSNTLAVEYIESTGYKFTSSQIKTLNKADILMMDKMKSMSLSEFYSLFSNNSFTSKVNVDWQLDPAIYVAREEKNNEKDDSTIKVYPQYIYIKKIKDKFEIELDYEFWNHMLMLAVTPKRYSISYITIKAMINLHRVVIALGCKPDKRLLDNIITNYEISGTSESKADEWFDDILRFYPDVSFGRSDMMLYISDSRAKFANVKMIIRSKFCSYDPMMDMYYWMNTESQDMKNYLLQRVVDYRDQDLYMHLVSMYHINFDHFKQYIQENQNCGWDDDHFIRTTLSFYRNQDLVRYYVDNKLIVNIRLLDYFRDEWIIKEIYKNCTSYDEKGFDRILELTHEKKFLICSTVLDTSVNSYQYRIFRSMSPRDQRIMTHLSYHSSSAISNIGYILRYDIHITQEHLEYLLSSGHENMVIKLLHISKKYYYLIDMINLEMALKCLNYLPRMWFYNNIVMAKLLDGLESSEFEFCQYDKSEQMIFNTKINDKPDADLPLDMENKFEEFGKEYRETIQMIQERALDRIISQ